MVDWWRTPCELRLLVRPSLCKGDRDVDALMLRRWVFQPAFHLSNDWSPSGLADNGNRHLMFGLILDSQSKLFQIAEAVNKGLTYCWNRGKLRGTADGSGYSATGRKWALSLLHGKRHAEMKWDADQGGCVQW